MDKSQNTDLDNFDEQKLWKVIGHNAKKAREFAGLTRGEAQALIFNYKNKEMHANRISEIESGNKKIDTKILYKMAVTYQVSMDYIMGLSCDPEFNMAASHNGLLHESMRGMMLEIGDKLTGSLHALMQYFPPFQGEVLNTKAKQLIDAIKPHQHNLVFKSEYPQIIDATYNLLNAVRDFETYKARQCRLIEMQMVTHLDEVENKLVATMSNTQNTVKSEKLD